MSIIDWIFGGNKNVVAVKKSSAIKKVATAKKKSSTTKGTTTKKRSSTTKGSTTKKRTTTTKRVATKNRVAPKKMAIPKKPTPKKPTMSKKESVARKRGGIKASQTVVPKTTLRNKNNRGKSLIGKKVAEKGNGATSSKSSRAAKIVIGKALPGIRCSRARTIQVGQYRKGEITRIMKWGVFVDLDSGDSGLVHIANLSWERCKATNISENGEAEIPGYEVGDEVLVKVLEVKADGKLSLGIKQAQCHPFDLQKEQINKMIGRMIDGKVEAIIETGILVKLLPGVIGLIPKYESKKFGRVKNGNTIRVYVDSVDWDKKHILLLKEKPVAVKKSVAVAVAKKGVVCVDGSNVIGDKSGFRAKILKSLVEALSANGYTYKVFLDKGTFAWLKRIKATKDLAYLQELETREELIVAPGKAEADGQLLQFAEYEKDSHVISNDRFRDYTVLHPWLKSGSRIHGFNVVSVSAKGTYRVLVAGFNMDVVVKV